MIGWREDQIPFYSLQRILVADLGLCPGQKCWSNTGAFLPLKDGDGHIQKMETALPTIGLRFCDVWDILWGWQSLLERSCKTRSGEKPIVGLPGRPPARAASVAVHGPGQPGWQAAQNASPSTSSICLAFLSCSLWSHAGAKADPCREAGEVN